MSRIGELLAPRRLGADFRWLIAAFWTSNVGDGVALAAAPLLIASMTSSPVLVAMGAMMQFLPWLLFGLHAGAIADRFDRRRMVMLGNALRGLVILALCGFLLTGHATIALVLIATFLYGTAEVFVNSASNTLLPMMVRPEDLGIGNARLQFGYLVASQLAGPPLGAFLFAIGSFWPFLLQVLCVLLAVLLVSRIAKTPAPERPSTGSGVGATRRAPVHTDIAEGIRWLWRNPPVRTLVLIILTFNVTWAAPWSILVLYATEHLHMGPVGYAALTTASAIGGILATLSFGWLDRNVSFALLMRICLTLEVLMHLSMALVTSGAVALLILVVFGAYAFIWGTISTTVRQRLVPLELQGRIGSVNMVGVFGGMVIGQVLGGVIAQTWGLTAPWWFAFAGAGVTLLLVWRSIGNITSAPSALDEEPAQVQANEP